MSIGLLSVFLIVTLIVLLVLGLPLAWSLGAVGLGVCLLQFDFGVVNMLVSRVFDLSQSYSLMAVPLFVLMAGILQRSGVAENLFKAAYVFAGGLRGGLALGTILANIVMATMVGVVGAEIVTLGMVALPQMLKNKYDDTLALGALAAGGGLATLIPPSVVFIVYGMTAGVSVSDLFLAGVIPGIILGVGYFAFIIIYVKLKPNAAPLPPEELRNMPLAERMKVLKGLVLPVGVTLGVLGSIYLGVATPTEAAGVGVALVILCSVLNKSISKKLIWDSCLETVKVSCMLSWLFFGAQTIIGSYTLAGGTHFVQDLITSADLGLWGTLIMMNLIWIVIGCFLDWIGILFLTVPIFLPIILGMGLDPIWFGVLFCMNMQISYMLPPFAPACFYMKSITPPEISMTRIYKGTAPYLIVTFTGLILLTFWWDLALFLPRIMK